MNKHNPLLWHICQLNIFHREFFSTVLRLNFPVAQYPVKIKSLNLSKTPYFSGVLKGVKGQYLIFEDNTVFNVRNNEGLVVNLVVN